MFDTLSFTPNSGDPITLNSDHYPIHDFDITVKERQNTERKRMQEVGLWPTRLYRDSMSIHMEGAILGDDPEDYVSKRVGLVMALQLDPTNLTPPRKHGTLHMKPAGYEEDWITDVIVAEFTAPIKASAGNWDASEFMITFISWTPYFVGAESGDYFYWT
jgi:hypothetical protein